MLHDLGVDAVGMLVGSGNSPEMDVPRTYGRSQLAAMACQTPFVKLAPEVLEETWNNYQPSTRRPYGLMEWPALLRKLDRMDTSYKT